MERLIRKRDLAVKKIRALKPQSDDEVIERTIAEAKRQMVEKLFENFSNIQEKIEDKADESELYEEQAQIGVNFCLEVCQIRATLTVNEGKSNEIVANNELVGSKASKVKLPEISLPKFNGELEKWTMFKDMFRSLIHNNTEITKIQKLYYLKASLEGEAEAFLRGFECTEANYEQAWSTLTERYENKRLIVQKHLANLLEQKPISHEMEIRKVVDTTNQEIRALEALGIAKEELRGMLITFIVTTKLPLNVKKEWELTLTDVNHIPKYAELETFLRKHASAADACTSKLDENENRNSKLTNKDAGGGGYKNISCPKCKKPHYLYSCPQFESLTVDQRIALVATLVLCANCLRPGHVALSCRSPARCRVCQRNHHSSLHRHTTLANVTQTANDSPGMVEDQENSSNMGGSPVQALAGQIGQNQAASVSLPTAKVKVNSNGNSTFTKARCLLDSASQANFISENLVRRCGLVVERSDSIDLRGVGNSTPEVGPSYKARFRVRSFCGDYEIEVVAYVLPRITGKLTPCSEAMELELRRRNIRLADWITERDREVDLLLGAVHFNRIIMNDFLDNFPGNITLRNTRLGWVAFGGEDTSTKASIQCNAICCFAITGQLQRFWELEEVKLNHKELTREEQFCEDYFQLTTVKEGNKFMVRIPFKEDPNSIGSSYSQALGQLRQSEKRFSRNPEYERKYRDFMNEYLSLGHMSEVKTNKSPGYYLPHHGVFKNSSRESSIRVVFNASCQSDNGLSLNKVMCVGPAVQKDLFDILIRFRSYKVALVADIEKMYRNILIAPEDRKWQRILWRENEAQSIKTYELDTVTYGTAAAPFLATRCLLQVATDAQIKFPEAAKKIQQDFYMDDFVSGADSLEQALSLQTDVYTLLNDAGFHLRKWKTNNPELANRIFEEKTWQVEPDESKILGIEWISCADVFTFTCNNIRNNWIVTKRLILSVVAKLFDPLGLLAPVIVLGKLLLQELWLTAMDWDEPVTMELRERFQTFCNTIKDVSSIKVPRYVQTAQATKIELHAFVDASEKAYGCVIYVRAFFTSKVFVNLLCAKTKVAPVKTVSLPRLELCAAALGAKLLSRVAGILGTETDHCYGWSDSTIVLSWLAKPAASWSVFIANRVGEIHGYLPTAQWRHVKGTENPADIASRGATTRQLRESSLWWYGPPWLKDNEAKLGAPWLFDSRAKTEMKKQVRLACAVEVKGAKEGLKLINETSSFVRLIRVTAYCFRFLERLRGNKQFQGGIKVVEFRRALRYWIRIAQEESFSTEIKNLKNKGEGNGTGTIQALNPFLDENGILRVGGRLKHTNWPLPRRHPVILPKQHRLTELLISFEHCSNAHAPTEVLLSILRRKYWIIGARVIVKFVLARCLSCFKQQAKTQTQLMGDLPAARIQPSEVFTKVGVDYAGPFSVRASKLRGRAVVHLQVYICLFVCMVTKAIHIEVVESLTAADFIAALKRFVARRGYPLEIYSDNGTNFTAANQILIRRFKEFIHSEELQTQIENYLTSRQVLWHFIPPSSPHFGGLWEANIKALKRIMRSVINETGLTLSEFNTLVIQVEACLNSRPLTKISDNPEDLEAITPGHFLTGRSLMTIPEVREPDPQVNIRDKWHKVQHLAHCIWRRWQDEYVAQLQDRKKWRKVCSNSNIGDLVLIKNTTNLMTRWDLGRIVATYPGADGLTRVVDIKTVRGILRRPISKIVTLPH